MNNVIKGNCTYPEIPDNSKKRNRYNSYESDFDKMIKKELEGCVMNRNNPIVNALRSQLDWSPYKIVLRTGKQTVDSGGFIPCTFKPKELETEIQKQMEGVRYE